MCIYICLNKYLNIHKMLIYAMQVVGYSRDI